MKKITSFLLTCFAIFLFLTGCKKNQSDEIYHETDVPVIPVFTEKVSCQVSGFITDEQGEPIAGAVIQAGSSGSNTDEFGHFSISGASVTKNIGVVKVVMPGYFTGYKTFRAQSGEDHFFRLVLLSKTNTGSVQAATGGSVTTPDGGVVSLPANAVKDAVTGAMYTGSIHISARLLPLSANNELLYSIPGDGRGLNAEGHLRTLNIRTAIAVDLHGDAGQKLQLANNSKATITLPVAPSLLAGAPSSIAMWSLNEETGLWKEEGTLTKNGTGYSGQVSHFSFWSGATDLPLVNFTARVLTTALQPIANAAVVITPQGLPFNAGFGKFAFTDANGFVNGAIPANSSLVLNVLTTCSNSSYNFAFNTTSANVDLGAITGNLGQSLVNITGTAVNCGGTPLVNGYVQTYDHGFYNRIPVINGSFSFSGISCTNLPISYVVVDNDNHQQSSPQLRTLSAGTNNFGALSACGINSLGSATYVIDGVTRSLTEPAETLAAYYFAPGGGSTTIAKISGGSGGTEFSFQFNGGSTSGTNHTVTDIWSVGFHSGRALALTPLTVSITEFGDIGGFVTGSFSGSVVDFADQTISYNIQYNFRVKRLN